jgi:hypothetical protein
MCPLSLPSSKRKRNVKLQVDCLEESQRRETIQSEFRNLESILHHSSTQTLELVNAKQQIALIKELGKHSQHSNFE